MRRSALVSPWHNCTRCSRKTHLSEMQWQRGVLVCTRSSCFDTGDNPLVGQRDSDISRALSEVAVSKEMQPDEKLTEQIPSSIEDIFF